MARHEWSAPTDAILAWAEEIVNLDENVTQVYVGDALFEIDRTSYESFQESLAEIQAAFITFEEMKNEEAKQEREAEGDFYDDGGDSGDEDGDYSISGVSYNTSTGIIQLF